MTRSEQILEYIDGTLGPMEEQSLFSEMAMQPELRAELRQYFQIGEAVRSDREAFAPPAFVERSLLGTLGMLPLAGEIAGTATGAAVATGFFAKLAALKSALPIVGAFVLGCLLAGTGMYFGVRGSNDGVTTTTVAEELRVVPVPVVIPRFVETTRTSSNTVSQNVPTPAATATPQGGVAPATTLAASTPRTPRVSPNRASFVDRSSRRTPRPSQPSTTVPTQLSTTTSNPTTTIALDTTVRPTDPSIAPSIMRESVEPTFDTSRSVALRSPASARFATSEVYKPGMDATVSFEFRQLFGAPVDYAAIAPSTPLEVLDNKAFGAYLHPAWGKGRVGIGGELGVDRYVEKLNFTDSDTLALYQQPDVFWFGPSIRYAIPVSEMVDLNLQLTVGGHSHSGGMGRARVGTSLAVGDVPIFGAMKLNASGEWSTISYRFNGRDQFSYRLGGSLGLEFTPAW